MAWERPNIVSGVTRATKQLFDKILDGIDGAHAGLADRPTKEEANATYGRQDKIVRSRDGALGVWGHSYAFGIGASDVGRRYGSLLAEKLQLSERMDAIAGTAVATESSGASWAAVLQKVTRNSRGAVAGSGVPSTTQRGFAPPGGVFVLNYGINDANTLGNTTTLLAPVKESMRVVLSRLRAGAIFEDTSPTFSYTGTWPAPASTDRNSGGSYRYASADGAAYTITTPEDFPGGTVCIGYHAPSGAGKGATHSVKIDGGTATSYEFRNARSGAVQPHVLRLKGLTPGVHTITGTVSGVSEYTAVDYWSWEAPEPECPLIAVLNQPTLVDYSAYGTPLVTDAGVLALNQVLADVVAEFGERTILVDLASMNKVAAYYMVDKLHPSDLGHQKIADLTYRAITRSGFTIETGTAPAQRVDRGTAIPTGTRTFYRVGDEIRNSNPVEEGTAGGKYITYGWICTVEGRPGTWLPLRYLTGN
ncbi:hypothetical protein [Rhodococcus sp. SGAir0479]|uniref:hypothetical protein n=1 Tax=Rhodococcus sp. SGAir0479 TaxID=2567884 RepID=UPI0010CD6142|nr:hypothetical protein [Rhodococcus sp. SGAir0479]QCQ91730.1 hypothetical protein E7742_11135 [Rhodococcus sp. SGAir0479]